MRVDKGYFPYSSFQRLRVDKGYFPYSSFQRLRVDKGYFPYKDGRTFLRIRCSYSTSAKLIAEFRKLAIPLKIIKKPLFLKLTL